MELMPHSTFFRMKLILFYFFQNSEQLTQFSKFCGVGILNTIIGYGFFFLFVNYTYYLAALLFAHIIGVTHSFIWNKFWIFKTKRFDIFEFIRFNVIYGAIFFVNAGALYVSVDCIHVNPRIAQLLLLPLITIVSFFGQKLWTFTKTVN